MRLVEEQSLQAVDRNALEIPAADRVDVEVLDRADRHVLRREIEQDIQPFETRREDDERDARRGRPRLDAEQPHDAVEERDEEQIDRDRSNQQQLVERRPRAGESILRAGQDVRHPVVVKDIAGEIRIDRNRRALRQLDHDRAAPDVVGREIGAIGLSVRRDLADVRERQADDERHQDRAAARRATASPGSVAGSVHRPCEPSRRPRERGDDQRRGDQQPRSAPAGDPQQGHHEAAERLTDERSERRDRQPALARRDGAKDQDARRDEDRL